MYASNERKYNSVGSVKSFAVKLLKWINDNSPPERDTLMYKSNSRVWSQVSEELKHICIEKNQQRISSLNQISSGEITDIDVKEDKDIYSNNIKVKKGQVYDIFL
jgi:hypothetical protein